MFAHSRCQLTERRLLFVGERDWRTDQILSSPSCIRIRLRQKAAGDVTEIFAAEVANKMAHVNARAFHLVIMNRQPGAAQE